MIVGKVGPSLQSQLVIEMDLMVGQFEFDFQTKKPLLDTSSQWPQSSLLII